MWGACTMKRYMALETPASPQELASTLKEAAAESKSISVTGNNSKCLMGGPLVQADVALSTAALNRMLDYEPGDLTVSVQAGMRWSELQHRLAQNGQTIALDPPFAAEATVGGVIASQSSGPLRARFGTARDLVIGMEFAMLDGKLIRAGGMVVKNVAGLDMGKLLIGSFGTLGAITSVNFRLHALPAATTTFVFSLPDLEHAIRQRDALLSGVLRPHAVDLLTPAVAERLHRSGYLLVLLAAGSEAVLKRHAAELPGAERLSGDEEGALWEQIREHPFHYLRRQPEGAILRVSTPLSELGTLLGLLSGYCISRAASGVTYVYLNDSREISEVWQRLSSRGWTTVVEYAPHTVRESRPLWLDAKASTENGFAMMKKIKQMFDPGNLLNRSRLYGRI